MRCEAVDFGAIIFGLPFLIWLCRFCLDVMPTEEIIAIKAGNVKRPDGAQAGRWSLRQGQKSRIFNQPRRDLEVKIGNVKTFLFFAAARS